MTDASKSPKSGAQRKREFDDRKRDQGLKELRVWCTEGEREMLRDTLKNFRGEK